MLKMLKAVFVWILALTVLCAGCNLSDSNSSNRNPTETTNDAQGPILAIHDLLRNENEYDGKLVRVKAQITGFHEIILFEGSRDKPTEFIQAVFPESARQELLEQARLAHPESADVKGTVVIKGRFVTNGGRLSTEPPRSIGNTTVSVVNRIDVTQFEGLQP